MPTPARPVVSLPAAREFGKILMLDLKEVKVRHYHYIFHMIDGFTCFTPSVFLKDKKPKTIINNMMSSWVANYGRPGKYWSDMSREFNNNVVRQMGEAVSCKMQTGAGYSAWMDGLNKRNHAVVDRCIGKILHNNPQMDPEVFLAWAVTEKKSSPMYSGFSSFQPKQPKQPKLPNIMEDKLPALEGKTTSKSLLEHILVVHAGTKAFMQAMCDKKVRKALRHNVWAMEQIYVQGEQVYYRRDSDKAVWHSPATVLGSHSLVYFMVHQGDMVRVAACRIVATEEVEKQIEQKKGKEAGHVLPDQAEEAEDRRTRRWTCGITRRSSKSRGPKRGTSRKSYVFTRKASRRMSCFFTRKASRSRTHHCRRSRSRSCRSRGWRGRRCQGLAGIHRPMDKQLLSNTTAHCLSKKY